MGALLGPIVANSCGGEGSGGAEARSLFLMVLGFCVGTVAYLLLLLATSLTTSSASLHVRRPSTALSRIPALRVPVVSPQPRPCGQVALLCGAGFLRAVSSSLVWVYSTLVVQNKVLGEAGGNPWANPMFGRVFALEMSVFTAGKLGSFVLGGAGLGFFTCDAECAATMLSAISFGATVVWVLLLLTSVGKHFGVGRSDDLQAPLNQAAPTAASW